MAISDELEAHGCRVAGPFHRCSDAMTWLANRTPDMAIIDIRLLDGSCAEIATTLRDRGIPFVVHTAWGCRNRPNEFQDAPCIDQPNSSNTLIAVMKGLLKQRVRDRAAAGESTRTPTPNAFAHSPIMPLSHDGEHSTHLE